MLSRSTWLLAGAMLALGVLAGYLLPRSGPRLPAAMPADTWNPATFKGTLTVATYNVRNFFDKHDNPYTKDGGEKPAREREALAEAIRTLDADVLILQEIEAGGVLRQFAEGELAGMKYENVVDATTEDARGITVAALSRFPVVRITSHRLAPVDDAAPPSAANRLARDLLRVDVRLRAGFDVSVYGVHLKSKRTDDEKDKNSSKRRLAEAVRIRGILREEMAPGARFVVLGDCNDPVDSPAVTAIREATDPPLADALASIPSEARITFQNPTYREAIDQVLLSPRLASDYVPGSVRIFSEEIFTKASDHRPVRVRLRMP